mmetsp:Transcript_22986/g.40590  ORF Transcript_22986/g.40590 Transcript_22986/m.40590 type:complete len:214 (-) Transcript_22986:145-786(-)
MREASSRQSWHCSPPHPRHCSSMHVVMPSSASAFAHMVGGVVECQCSSQHLCTFLLSSWQSWHCSPEHPLHCCSMQLLASTSQTHVKPSAPHRSLQGSLVSGVCVLQTSGWAATSYSLQHWEMRSASSRQSWHCSPPQPLHCASMQDATPSSASALMHMVGGVAECQCFSQHSWMRLASARQSWHCSPPQPLHSLSMHDVASTSHTHVRASAP